MNNITENIKRAIRQNVSWGYSDFYYFMEILEKNKFEVGFSIDDNEQCAAVGVNDSPIAYVWRKSPLMFIRTDYLVDIKALLGKEFTYMEIIAVDDLSADVFSLHPDNELMGRIRYLFDLQCFSANDFWFYNVT